MSVMPNTSAVISTTSASLQQYIKPYHVDYASSLPWLPSIMRANGERAHCGRRHKQRQEAMIDVLCSL
jgi:hypothetical protein